MKINSSQPRSVATPKTSETYVPLSRGWRAHLRKLSGNAVKPYNLLLIDAKFSGGAKGTVAATFRELAEDLNIHRQSAFKAAKELRPHYLTWTPAINQHDLTVFTVQRYKAIADFAVSCRTDGAADSRRAAGRNNRPASLRQGYSTPRNPNERQELQFPNNERKKRKSAFPSETHEAWEYAKAGYVRRYQQEPDWAHKKHWNQLSALMTRKGKDFLPEFKRRWDRFMESTDQWHEKQHGSLGWFCGESDKFADDPRRARPIKTNGTGIVAAYSRRTA